MEKQEKKSVFILGSGNYKGFIKKLRKKVHSKVDWYFYCGRYVI